MKSLVIIFTTIVLGFLAGYQINLSFYLPTEPVPQYIEKTDNIEVYFDAPVITWKWKEEYYVWAPYTNGYHYLMRADENINPDKGATITGAPTSMIWGFSFFETAYEINTKDKTLNEVPQ